MFFLRQLSVSYKILSMLALTVLPLSLFIFINAAAINKLSFDIEMLESEHKGIQFVDYCLKKMTAAITNDTKNAAHKEADIGAEKMAHVLREELQLPANFLVNLVLR